MYMSANIYVQMHACICPYIHTCIHLCKTMYVSYIRTHTYTCIRIYVYIYIYVKRYTYIRRIYTHASIHICTRPPECCIHACVYIYARVCLHIHTCMYTYIHTCVCMRTCVSKRLHKIHIDSSQNKPIISMHVHTSAM